MVAKITIYTITTCPFSKQEKDYLTVNKFAFEEKNVEEKKEYLSEMLAASDDFAGVPFTIIEKDDGTKELLKGFTKEVFDKALGLVKEEVKPTITGVSQPDVIGPPAPMPPPPAPSTVSAAGQKVGGSTIPENIGQPQMSTPTSSVQSVNNVPTNTSQPAQPSVDNSLNSLLENLQQKVQEPVATQPNPPTNTSTPNMPQIPDFPKQ